MSTPRKSNASNPVAKHQKNPTSLRRAVDAHCYMCMGGEKTDLSTQKNVVSLIRDCHSEICPLQPFRPFTSRKIGVKSGD